MKDKDTKRIEISAIIPVYNVYDYLDICMESIVNQTFSDFEVILIDDGSTDGSDIKCVEWAQRDRRIRVISKENEGPSEARNCGIRNALGQYLVFIDSDDWVDATYLEKLHEAIVRNNAAIAECDIYRFHNGTGEYTYHACSGRFGLPYSLEEHMIYGSSAIWKCMFAKSLFVENKIFFPNCHGEAKAMYGLLLALGGSIVNVQEGLYYYRRFREGSLTGRPRANNGDEDAVGLLAADYLIQGFQNCGLYGEYEEILQKSIITGLSDRLAGLFYRKKGAEFLGLTDRYYAYIRTRFPGVKNFRYITIGGYNLNRILSHMNWLHNPYGRFNFSSIISIMHPVKQMPICRHKNKYREIMVNRDITSSIWGVAEKLQPEYIFMDFIEERFDILHYFGGFITRSDAFVQAETEWGDFRIIERNSEECFRLWKDSMMQFVEKVEAQGCKIVVVENYLSEEVGDVHRKEYFENVEAIREMNLLLKKYYEFIRGKYKDIPIVKAFARKFYYTDEKYEYGAVPSHLNEFVNGEIAEMVETVV